jgi:hypothetical protein
LRFITIGPVALRSSYAHCEEEYGLAQTRQGHEHDEFGSKTKEIRGRPTAMRGSISFKHSNPPQIET